ncbi:tetratricopeptide repeat protein [Archangium gephyra]|uniref:tetratricopeptide repeat protein n=1 Tax=Archangium gephyra TaxID=48 RepID=UPI0014711F1D|nr:SEL1-like repeat protein [Archangium gephyra]
MARRSVALCVVIGLLGTGAMAQQEASSAPSSPGQEPVAQGAPVPPSPEKKPPVSAEASQEDSGVPPDARGTAALHEKACEGGDAVACGKLGLAYARGEGVDKDMRRAAVLFEKACEGGDASGCYLLGVIHEKGLGVSKDERRAAALHEKACEGGNAPGCTSLGSLYEEGLGVPKDERRAAALHEKACEGGNAPGCTNLGTLYAEGLGVPKDEHRAAVLFEKACEGGSAPGCNNLGLFHVDGRGVPKDEHRAAVLFEKACEGGSAQGCIRLGLSYMEGQGVNKDMRRAAVLFEKACEGGDAPACNLLGTMHAEGLGVPKDERRAAALYEKACKGGSTSGCKNLGQVGQDKQRAAALPETKRDAASQTIVFDVVLSSATRQEMRAAIKKEGVVPEREDDAYWYDLYSAKGLLDGAEKLKVGYVDATGQLAVFEYEFPSFMNTEQVGQISSMVQAKYGAPTSKKGKISLGDVVHTWKRKDGVIITVSRGWPSTTTFLTFTVPTAKKAMDAEVEANKKAKAEKQSKKSSKAF